MNSELLIYGSKNFNNSLKEVKEYLGFSLFFYDFSKKKTNVFNSIAGVIVDEDVLANFKNSNLLDEIKNKPILLIQTSKKEVSEYFFSETLFLPISLFEMKNKINNNIAAFKFSLNSSIKIKEYILNKNEKKLSKSNFFISLTEREVQLIEVLYKEKNSISKSSILKKIWKYSDIADTHTVETHIYRLRKKIYSKFNDNSFIINSSNGYTI